MAQLDLVLRWKASLERIEMACRQTLDIIQAEKRPIARWRLRRSRTAIGDLLARVAIMWAELARWEDRDPEIIDIQVIASAYRAFRPIGIAELAAGWMDVEIVDRLFAIDAELRELDFAFGRQVRPRDGNAAKPVRSVGDYTALGCDIDDFSLGYESAHARPDTGSLPADSEDSRTSAADRARFVTLAISETEDRRELALNEGLVVGRTYRIAVDLSKAPDPWQRDAARPLTREDDETLTLSVALVPRGADALLFVNQVGRLEWGPQGVRAPSFLIEAKSAGIAVFDVLIHRDHDLLFAAAVTVEIVQAGATWTLPQPIGWSDATDAPRSLRSRAFRRFARLRQDEPGKRAACVAVQKAEGPDTYVMTVLAGEAEMPVRAVFSRAELDAMWSRLRGILDRARRDPVMLDGGYGADGGYDGDFSGATCRRGGTAAGTVSATRVRDAMDDYMRDLALAGVSFRSALFADPQRKQVLAAIQAATAADEATIQIWLDRDAAAFQIPWHWLYDGPLDPTYRDDKADPALFWGSRMIIEQVADWLDPSIVDPPSPLLGAADGSIRVRIGSWPFAELADHVMALRQVLGQSGRAVDLVEWPSDRDWETFLPRCDASLLYFFAHGHTAIPVSLGSEALRAFIADLDQSLADGAANAEVSPNGQSALDAMRGALADLKKQAMWYDHHIRLKQGYLKIEDLQNFMPVPGTSTLVVLNMCESAQVYPSLSDGLAHNFLRYGAVGVLGTEVAMPPSFADLFGRQLMSLLTDGSAIGPALLELRRSFLARRNPLGFAYSYYGDISARLMPAAGFEENGR